MCERVTLDELLDDDRLEYAEYSHGRYLEGNGWIPGEPTGRMIPTAAGRRLLDFIKRHLTAEEA